MPVNSTALEDLCWAAIDFESAGTAPGETDCPVQIGIVRVERLFSETPQPELFRFLINIFSLIS